MYTVSYERHTGTFFITRNLKSNLQLIYSFFVKIHSSFLCCQASFEYYWTSCKRFWYDTKPLFNIHSHDLLKSYKLVGSWYIHVHGVVIHVWVQCTYILLIQCILLAFFLAKFPRILYVKPSNKVYLLVKIYLATGCTMYCTSQNDRYCATTSPANNYSRTSRKRTPSGPEKVFA